MLVMKKFIDSIIQSSLCTAGLLYTITVPRVDLIDKYADRTFKRSTFNIKINNAMWVRCDAPIIT